MRTSHDEINAIETLIAKQFASLHWTPDRPADWRGFSEVFFPGASLVAAARPAKRQSVEDFIARMKGLAGTTLTRFEETKLGSEILVFGNVAVALGACEMLENGTEVTRDVSGFLLIKDQGEWRIAAQAWDLETESNPIPANLRTPT